MKEKKFKRYFKALYQDNKINSLFCKAYLLNFLLRRLIYVTMGLVITNQKRLIVQLVITLIMNLLTLIYLG